MKQFIQANIVGTLVAVALGVFCFVFSQSVQAAGPDTEGAIVGVNNGEGIGVLVNVAGGISNTGTGYQALNHLTTGDYNTANGVRALFSDTDGSLNTANGVNALLSNTTGGANTANGANALYYNTTGSKNTGSGVYALFTNTTGSYNTANGYNALRFNTTGTINTANGVNALFSNTTGSRNTASGVNALYNNTTGATNTVSGVEALFNNTTGGANTANGERALYYNTTGDINTANGVNALYFNTTGDWNTANGFGALMRNTTGEFNTANGAYALLNNTTGRTNTATGFRALPVNTTGSDNTALGRDTGAGITTAHNVIVIGANLPGENVSDSCYIGNIFSRLSSGGTAVFVNSAGKLGTTTSSRRFKDEIKPMDEASEAVLALKPVTFRYNKEIEPEGIPQWGLVAEEVENVNPDLVVRDAEGRANTVRYEAVNAMLLNEFLKEHRTVQELKAVAATQAAAIAQQQRQIEALTATVQKVSEQMVLGKSAPQLVTNP